MVEDEVNEVWDGLLVGDEESEVEVEVDELEVDKEPSEPG